MLASRGVSQERSECAKASKLRWKSYTRTTETQPAVLMAQRSCSNLFCLATSIPSNSTDIDTCDIPSNSTDIDTLCRTQVCGNDELTCSEPGLWASRCRATRTFNVYVQPCQDFSLFGSLAQFDPTYRHKSCVAPPRTYSKEVERK
jgi:hypothetical protein